MARPWPTSGPRGSLRLQSGARSARRTSIEHWLSGLPPSMRPLLACRPSSVSPSRTTRRPRSPLAALWALRRLGVRPGPPGEAGSVLRNGACTVDAG
eukprot:343770-Alexandrium_andersonii.AAC.1